MRQCCDHRALLTKKYNPFREWESVRKGVKKMLKKAKNYEGDHNYDHEMIPVITNEEGYEISTHMVYEMY